MCHRIGCQLLRLAFSISFVDDANQNESQNWLGFRFRPHFDDIILCEQLFDSLNSSFASLGRANFLSNSLNFGRDLQSERVSSSSTLAFFDLEFPLFMPKNSNASTVLQFLKALSKASDSLVEGVVVVLGSTFPKFFNYFYCPLLSNFTAPPHLHVFGLVFIFFIFFFRQPCRTARPTAVAARPGPPRPTPTCSVRCRPAA